MKWDKRWSFIESTTSLSFSQYCNAYLLAFVNVRRGLSLCGLGWLNSADFSKDVNTVKK